MPQRHSKNNNDLAFFTYDEKRKLGLCLKPFVSPLCCPKGHLFCKECILECLLSQKKDINRRLAAYAAQQKQEREEEEEKLMEQKARRLDAFDRQNHGAVPHYDGGGAAAEGKSGGGGGGFQGANSVKVTSYEEEALRNMKAFWLPSATPEAAAKVEAPCTATVCPEGKEKLKLKSLFPIRLTGCKVTLTNTHALVAVSTCGDVFCKKCAEEFVAACKARHLVPLQKGGTGFSGHDDRLEATDFKHLGSGSGLGLVRPATKT
ncbi:unnamed protein product [Spirodela intermedia]|uniref:Nitric oxide synthase-interacting protein n=1 Tax=Spirodela intermedia TaxID=51605 RepID=A0A7I8IFN8_SPIIN|nr:unnamed protein product [Spirodela intermedia]CAA6656630.1 unnamed protein product [Spirodela intermedia]